VNVLFVTGVSVL